MTHPHPTVGHVHLRIADLEQHIVLYRDVLGSYLSQCFGTSAALQGAGG